MISQRTKYAWTAAIQAAKFKHKYVTMTYTPPQIVPSYQIKARINAIISKVAEVGFEKWREIARNKLRSTFKAYNNSMDSKLTADANGLFSVTFTLDGGTDRENTLARSVEFGTAPYDMTQKLAYGEKKVVTFPIGGGKWDKNIFGARSDETGKWQAHKQLAKIMRTKGQTFTFRSTYTSKAAQERGEEIFPWIAKRGYYMPKKERHGKVLQEQNASNISRYERMTRESTGWKVYRTMSYKHKGTSKWKHPGIKAKKLGVQVKQYMETEIKKRIKKELGSIFIKGK